MDPTGKWWGDAELNQYLGDWEGELQRDYELVWGTCTIVTASNTILLSTMTPAMDRLDAIYYGTGTSSGYRLAGRLLEDLEVLSPEWRSALPDTPRLVVQYDSTQMVVWPPLSTLGTFVFEYPQRLSLPTDNNLIQLPVWCQWSAKYYVAHRAFLRSGPTNDLRRAMRYKALYEKSKLRIKLLWDNMLPERFRRLKPAGHYEWDILCPPPAFDTGSSGGGVASLSQYLTFILLGAVDGINTLFTIPVSAAAVKIYRNGFLQTPNLDYTVSVNLGFTLLTFLRPPDPGDLLIAWAYVPG
jgi:hypothetical protein